MKIPQPIVLMVSSGYVSVITLFWEQSVVVMLPWLFVVLAAVIADLASGKYKSGKLGIHFAWSTAIRESVGKLVVYSAAIMTFAMFDVAAKGDTNIAKWLSIFLSSVEIGSFISNVLICHGIKLSLKAILKLILKKSPFGIDDEAADEIIKAAKREDKKWNKAKSRRFKEDEDSLYAFSREDGRQFDKVVGTHYDEETNKIVYDHNL